MLIFVDITAGRDGFLSIVFAADETGFHNSPYDLRITNYVLQSLACLTLKFNTTRPSITSTLS